MELDSAIDSVGLGRHIRRALDAYRETGQVVYAPEWEARNRRLLEFFGERSVSSFERKKKEVTVREEVATKEIRFFTPKESSIVLHDPSEEELGASVRSLLGLSSAARIK